MVCFHTSYSTVSVVSNQILNLMELLINANGNVVIENANCENALSKAYSLSDKCFFLGFLENDFKKLDIFSSNTCVKLLFIMANEKNWTMLSKILDKSEINSNSNSKLLNLALQVLKNEEINVFNEIVNRCSNVNAVLDGGETFITNLFKNNVKENFIEFVIKSQIFDSKEPNINRESALMLACSRLMVDIVPLLLQEGCEVSYSEYGAVEMTVLAHNAKKTAESGEKKNKILSLFFEENDSKSLIRNVIPYSCLKSIISLRSQYVIPRNIAVEKHFSIENLSKFNYLETMIVSLFGKSDNLDFLISLNGEKKNCDQIKNTFKKILSLKIVYPLREFGVVSHHRIKELSNCYKNINILEQENCLVFLSKISNKTNLLNFITCKLEESESMVFKLFVDLKNSYDYITFQDLFNLSMTQNQIWFKKPPECLIVHAIRDPNSIFSYKNIIPSKTIEISNLIITSFQKCCNCLEKAIWQCFTCITGNAFDVTSGLFCNAHKCPHPESVNLPQPECISHSKVYMKLSAIVYKLNNKYAALIRQKNSQHLWFSFKETDNGNRNLSMLSYDKEISQILCLNEKEIKNILMRCNLELFQQIIGNSHYFIYENCSLTCC